jgi:hypothetical protein
MTKPDFIELIAKQGQIMCSDAARVFELYRKLKIVNATASHGYEIKHGAFLDQDVITRAINQVNAVKH